MRDGDSNRKLSVYAIMGVTGKVGGAAARGLLADGRSAGDRRNDATDQARASTSQRLTQEFFAGHRTLGRIENTVATLGQPRSGTKTLPLR